VKKIKREKRKMKIKNIAIVTLINLFMAVGALASAPTNDNLANAQVLSGIRVQVSGTNVDATKEANEPNHANNVGGKSVWFEWTAPMSRLMQISTNRSATNLDTLLHVYTGTLTSIGSLSHVTNNNNIGSGNLKSRAVFSAIAGTTYYIAIDGFAEGTAPAAAGAFQLDIQPYFIHQGADFDSDGMTDLSVFRPSTGDWIVNGTNYSFSDHWGTNGDIPVIVTRSTIPGQTVFRPSDGIWYHRPSCCDDLYVPFGTSGDIPVGESFTGSSSNFTVFRPSNGTWYIHSPSGIIRYYQFGLQGDIPVPGQYSPDHFADVAVFRPSDGVWYFMTRVSGVQESDTFGAVKFGQAGDKPVPADYDGDGLLDIAVYRPSTGTWWVLRSSDGQATAFRWGIAEDIPTTGNFDGDGKFDYAVFRPSEATWYIYRSGDNQVQIRQFGQTGDIPMTANKSF
jgi:hypothetical protein